MKLKLNNNSLLIYANIATTITIIILLSNNVDIINSSSISKETSQQLLSKANKNNSQDWWLEQRAKFYERTTFPLNEIQIQYLGGDSAKNKTGHLPFWFDFELYLHAFQKSYNKYSQYEQHHWDYVTNCAKILRKRVLREILAGTDIVYIDSKTDSQSKTKFDTYKTKIGSGKERGQDILDYAISLVKGQMDSLRSKNQIVNYLAAMDEVNRYGSAIPHSRLPYKV